MTVQEKINELKTSTENKQQEIETLRTERAELTVNARDPEKPKIKTKILNIDSAINKLQTEIDNAPAELKLLEQQLADEHQRQAQEEQEALLKQQRSIVEDVERLSSEFIKLLQKANAVNDQLIAAIQAETGIRNKTGTALLTEYCHGSQQSLKALLEKSQQEMSGVHVPPAGPGIVRSAMPILL